jgi:hypothetical protein
VDVDVDVDVVVPVATAARMRGFERRLEACGLRQDTGAGAPICRWLTPERQVVDVIPSEENVVGFSKPRFPVGCRTAVPIPWAAG